MASTRYLRGKLADVQSQMGDLRDQVSGPYDKSANPRCDGLGWEDGSGIAACKEHIGQSDPGLFWAGERAAHSRDIGRRYCGLGRRSLRTVKPPIQLVQIAGQAEGLLPRSPNDG